MERFLGAVLERSLHRTLSRYFSNLDVAALRSSPFAGDVVLAACHALTMVAILPTSRIFATACASVHHAGYRAAQDAARASIGGSGTGCAAASSSVTAGAMSEWELRRALLLDSGPPSCAGQPS